MTDSKALSWPCGCMLEGLMYCGQTVTALSNKIQNFWMQNLAEVVSPHTQGSLCQGAENQGEPKGSGRRKMVRKLSLLFLSKEGGYFRTLTFREWPGCKVHVLNEVKNKRSPGEAWDGAQGEERGPLNAVGNSAVSDPLSSYLGSVSLGF